MLPIEQELLAYYRYAHEYFKARAGSGGKMPAQELIQDFSEMTEQEEERLRNCIEAL